MAHVEKLPRLGTNYKERLQAGRAAWNECYRITSFVQLGKGWWTIWGYLLSAYFLENKKADTVHALAKSMHQHRLFPPNHPTISRNLLPHDPPDDLLTDGSRDAEMIDTIEKREEREER